MDKIFINNLVIETIIGVYEHELHNKQPLILDLELAINSKQAADTDDILYTVPYDKVIETISHLSEIKQFKLLETYAEFITQNLLEAFNTNWIKLKITKPKAMPHTTEVGIVIERSKS